MEDVQRSFQSFKALAPGAFARHVARVSWLWRPSRARPSRASSASSSSWRRESRSRLSVFSLLFLRFVPFASVEDALASLEKRFDGWVGERSLAPSPFEPGARKQESRLPCGKGAAGKVEPSGPLAWLRQSYFRKLSVSPRTTVSLLSRPEVLDHTR